jgi:peptidoglycan/LPS O-acetylase OafA/YrhL
MFDAHFAPSVRGRWAALVSALAILAGANWMASEPVQAWGGWACAALLLTWYPLRQGASFVMRTGMNVRPTPASFVVRSGQRLPELDGIRGLAILLVVLYHYVFSYYALQSGLLGDFIRSSLNLGWSGVDLFFVLSGFLIGGILLDNHSSPHYFKAFYVRRICRIFPLYFVGLFLFVAERTILSTYFPNSILAPVFIGTVPVWEYFTFTQNIGVALGQLQPSSLGALWSLGVEEQFYLGFSLLVALISPRKLPYAFILLAALAPLLRVGLFGANRVECIACYVLTPTRADSLLLGALGAYALRQPRLAQYLYDHLQWLYALFAVLLLGTVTLSYAPVAWPGAGGLITTHSILNASIGYSWLAVLYLVLILLVLLDRHGILGRLAAMRWLRQLGILAYGIYILHLPVFQTFYLLFFGSLVQPSETGLNLVKVFSILVTLCIAYLSWNFFEKNIVAWGHRFEYGETRLGSHQPAMYELKS